MLKKIWFYCTLITLTMFLFVNCTSPVAGSGTQTTNGICIALSQNKMNGYLFTIDNDSIQKRIKGDSTITMTLFKADYQPYNHRGFSTQLNIDSTGNFGIDSLQNGVYNLLATCNHDSTALLLNEISISGISQNYTKEYFFSRWSTIKGIVNDSSKKDAPYKGVYIPGTPFFSITDTSGKFDLNKIPTGNYHLYADYFTKKTSDEYIKILGFFDDSTRNGISIYTDSVSILISKPSLIKIDMKL